MVDIENVVRYSTRTHELRQRCNGDVAALVNAYRWEPKHDLRIAAITRLTRLLVGLEVSFAYLANAQQDDFLMKVRLPGEENIAIEQFLICNEIFLKLGFVSTLFSVVEGAVKSYLQYVDPQAFDSNASIMSKCNCFLNEKLQWTNYRFDCKVFDFLRLIRNTLHSNGMHFPLGKNDSNARIEYRGTIYEFRDEQRLDFVTWDLLFDIANDLRTLLFQIAHNSAISKIPSPMPDVYL